MKRAVFLLFIGLIFIMNVFAQKGGPPERKNMVEELKEELNLTDTQVAKVEVIFNANKKKMDAIFEKKQQDESEFRKTMEEARENTDKEIEKILTEEQKALFKQFKEKHKKGMGEMPPPPPGQKLGFMDELPLFDNSLMLDDVRFFPICSPGFFPPQGYDEFEEMSPFCDDYFDLSFEKDDFHQEFLKELQTCNNINRLARILNLTEEQSEKIASIISEQEEQINSILSMSENKIVKELNENQKFVYRELTGENNPLSENSH